MQVFAVGSLFMSAPPFAIQKWGLSLLKPRVGGLEQEVT